MQSKAGQAEIQDGGERQLENQLYVITTVFMVQLCSNFQNNTVPTITLRKWNQNRDTRKSKMAANAILKINYTL
jgi:hypothetical protein